jgi:hypothetical protein
MRNIFILYMPPGNQEAMVHYQDTIRNKVPLGRIVPFVSRDIGTKLRQVFADKPVAVWGSRYSLQNESKFDAMQEGDEVLIVEGPTIRLLGRVAAKIRNAELSHELWKPLRGDSSEPWELVYFIANAQEINVPFAQFLPLVGYESSFQLRGFMRVSDDRLRSFYAQYDDLYSILLRMKLGQRIEPMREPDALRDAPQPSIGDRDHEQLDPSEHLDMQHLLLRMGRMAGEKVWAPRGDQGRITSRFQFTDFEETFAAGLDAQVKYVENIDVVWKHEFRINAAFEIENSTAIYSGLLRFADLATVAPNTIYPMFIVAPGERRQRVREQLARPVFKQLHLSEKVSFLPYSKVREVSEFFGVEGRGLTAEVLIGKAEKLAA